MDRSAFVGCRFPAEVILLAVRWYLRYGLSYRDVEELLAERGIEVDHVTMGAALHPDADRRRSTVPPRGRWSLVRRRDLREGRWEVALRVPRYR